MQAHSKSANVEAEVEVEVKAVPSVSGGDAFLTNTRSFLLTSTLDLDLEGSFLLLSPRCKSHRHLVATATTFSQGWDGARGG
jgi:hypothetical protein